MRLRCAERQPGHARDLSVAHALCVGQGHTQTFGRSQLRERLFEVYGERGVGHHRCRGFTVVFIWGNGHGYLRSTCMLEPDVDSDLPQPPAEGGGCVKPAHIPPCAHERLLRQVVGCCRVAAHPSEQCSHRPLASPNQLLERDIVALSSQDDEGGLRRCVIRPIGQDASSSEYRTSVQMTGARSSCRTCLRNVSRRAEKCQSSP